MNLHPNVWRLLDKTRAVLRGARLQIRTLVREAKLGVSEWVKVPVEQGLTNHSYRVLQPLGGEVKSRTKRLKRIHEEPGAGKTARRDLCGGCWATGSPTAIRCFGHLEFKMANSRILSVS